MIRSIPNPPMATDDIARFRDHLEKHIRGDFSVEELRRMNDRKHRSISNAQKIIANSGGINPILGY